MRFIISTAALAGALTFGACTTVLAATPGGFVHAGGGLQGHGFGFHHFLPRPTNQARAHFRFGRGFRSRSVSVAGGYGDDEGSYGSDDISELHFRVQEPFGPGDIGRPPMRAEEGGPYSPDRMDPWHGDEPPDW
jgi:hypothetical protein